MELEEAISKLEYELDKSKIVKKYQGKPKELFDDLDEYIKSIETVLNHITKQEKMIENIFSYFDDHRIDDNICDEILDYGAKDCIHNGNCTECIKQYFEKKAEEK